MVKKKDFTSKDTAGKDIVGEITEEQSAEIETQKPKNRFTARFTDREWDFITEKHWQKRMSITDILREYVQEDMKKNPEIVASIDELNGNNKNPFA